MTKREYLHEALTAAGVKKIYKSIKELKHAAGTQYGGILRAADKPVRAKSKKSYVDQEGITQNRDIRYNVETTYNVVIADADEDAAEVILEKFLLNLGKGYADDHGSWLKITPEETEWLGEEDNVMKSKVAIQILIRFEYQLYVDSKMEKLPDNTTISVEEDT